MIDCGSPYDYGLVTPNLRQIEIILPNYDLNAEMQEWLILDKAKKLFAENQKLEEIFVVQADTADSQMRRTQLMHICTPRFNFWEKRKLILLAMFKEEFETCSIARLQYDMLREICAMVSGSWIVEMAGKICKVVD